MNSLIGGDANNLRITLRGIANAKIVFRGFGWSKLGFDITGYGLDIEKVGEFY
jgi:hypothetical protein